MFFRKISIWHSQYKLQTWEKETAVCLKYTCKSSQEFDENYILTSNNNTKNIKYEEQLQEKTNTKWKPTFELQKCEGTIPYQKTDIPKTDNVINVEPPKEHSEEAIVLAEEVEEVNKSPPKSILKKTQFVEPYEIPEERKLTLVSEKTRDGPTQEFVETTKLNVAKNESRTERRDTKAVVALQRARAKEEKEWLKKAMREDESQQEKKAIREDESQREKKSMREEENQKEKKAIREEGKKATREENVQQEKNVEVNEQQQQKAKDKKMTREEKAQQKKALLEEKAKQKKALREENAQQKTAVRVEGNVQQQKPQLKMENNDISYKTRMSMLYSSDAANIFFTQEENAPEEQPSVASTSSGITKHEKQAVLLKAQEEEDDYEPEVYVELEEPPPVEPEDNVTKKKKNMSKVKSKKSKGVKNIAMHEQDDEEGHTYV